MRAREFTINVPINIKINGDGDPEIDVDGQDVEEPEADDVDPVFMSPQQQEIELQKSEQGKKSPQAAQMVDDPDNEDNYFDPDNDQEEPEEIGDPRQSNNR